MMKEDPFRVLNNLNGKGFTMYNAKDQFAEINKVGYDNAVKLASLSLEKAERLTKLNLQAAKVALEQGVYSANAVAGIKDVQELVAVRAKLTEAGMQNAMGYSRGVYQIASEAQADFSALAEQAFAMYTKGIAAWVEKAAKNAPAGSDVAVTAMKSTVAATTAAFDQFSKATKQVVSFADASMRAASANAANVAKAATATKGRKAA
jgi:phasin family protein